MNGYGDARLPVRFWTKVTVASNGCWLWTGALAQNGYGFFQWDRRQARAHRVSYQQLVGPIPDERPVLDHLCHDHTCQLANQCPHRRCVNPAHLEPVTVRQNVLRGNLGTTARALGIAKPFCPQGHPRTSANLFAWSNGFRRCRTCYTDQLARRRAARRGVS